MYVEASSSLMSTEVCDLTKPKGGLAKPSFAVEAVMVLLIEFAVSGRGVSWVIVALLWLEVGLDVGLEPERGKLSMLRLATLGS